MNARPRAPAFPGTLSAPAQALQFPAPLWPGPGPVPYLHFPAQHAPQSSDEQTLRPHRTRYTARNLTYRASSCEVTPGLHQQLCGASSTASRIGAPNATGPSLPGPLKALQRPRRGCQSGQEPAAATSFLQSQANRKTRRSQMPSTAGFPHPSRHWVNGSTPGLLGGRPPAQAQPTSLTLWTRALRTLRSGWSFPAGRGCRLNCDCDCQGFQGLPSGVERARVGDV